MAQALIIAQPCTAETRTYSSCITETSYHLKATPRPHLPSPLVTTVKLFASMSLTIILLRVFIEAESYSICMQVPVGVQHVFLLMSVSFKQLITYEEKQVTTAVSRLCL